MTQGSRIVWGIALSALAITCGKAEDLHPQSTPSSPTGADAGQEPGAGQDGNGGASGSTGSTAISAGAPGFIHPTPQADAGGNAAEANLDAGTSEVPMELREVPYRALALASARLHTCILLDDHQVKCVGNNFVGQLGTGDIESRPYRDGLANVPVLDLGTGRSVLSLSAGRYTTCAVLDDHSVKCWGYNSGMPPGSESAGDAPGEMGDALPTIDLGEGRTAQQVSVAEDTGCALLDDGNVRLWQYYGELATHPVLGNAVEITATMGSAGLRYADGSIGWLGGIPYVVNGHATALFGDRMFAVCASYDDGSTLCGDFDTDWYPSVQGPYRSLGLLWLQTETYCVVSVEGDVSCLDRVANWQDWAEPGAGGNGEHVLPVRLGGKATAVSGGGYQYICALMEDGNVKCWGTMSEMIPEYVPDQPIPSLDLGTHLALVPVTQ